jgi:hypothetical protein
MTTLFRPVGLQELSLIWDSGMREFPPRLPQQPIFYPVATMEYAAQIGRDWNTRDENSGYAGFVTQFAVPTSYLQKYEQRTVGSSSHVEYWIPADQLPVLNASIQGAISVERAYFGEDFKGCILDESELRGKDAVQQFVTMFKALAFSTRDFVCAVSASRKAVYLNFLFWAQFDFTGLGINEQRRDTIIARLREAWEVNHIEMPLPVCR